MKTNHKHKPNMLVLNKTEKKIMAGDEKPTQINLFCRSCLYMFRAWRILVSVLKIWIISSATPAAFSAVSRCSILTATVYIAKTSNSESMYGQTSKKNTDKKETEMYTVLSDLHSPS
jgi:hypothetical protein